MTRDEYDRTKEALKKIKVADVARLTDRSYNTVSKVKTSATFEEYKGQKPAQKTVEEQQPKDSFMNLLRAIHNEQVRMHVEIKQLREEVSRLQSTQHKAKAWFK